jgi:cytochrome c553
MTGSRLLALALLLLAAACGREAAQQPKAEAARALAFERVSADPLEHGARMARVLGCRGCHKDDLTGGPWSEDPEVAILFTSNLTRALPHYSDAQLVRAIREGVRNDGSPLWEMPSEIFTELADEDLTPLIRWLRTVPPAGEAHPRMVVGPAGRREIASGELRPAPEVVRTSRGQGPPPVAGGHDWARYMIRATCAECHRLDLSGWTEEEDGPHPVPAVDAHRPSAGRTRPRPHEAGRAAPLRSADGARGRCDLRLSRSARGTASMSLAAARREE